MVSKKLFLFVMLFLSLILVLNLISAISIFNLKSLFTGNIAISSTPAWASDNFYLDTSSRHLFYNGALNSPRLNVSEAQMPEFFANATLVDKSKNQYNYTQLIILGNRNISYGIAGGDLSDPNIYIDGGISASSPLYTYVINFSTPINISDPNVTGSTITLLGYNYTILPRSSPFYNSSSSILYLYGGGNNIELLQGEPVIYRNFSYIYSGTLVNLINQSGKLKEIDISVAMQNVSHDIILPGETYSDPIFGTLNLSFGGFYSSYPNSFNSAVDDAIIIYSDSDKNLIANLTTFLVNSSAVFSFLHDQRADTSVGNPLMSGNLRLADSANKTLHVIENDSIYANEYMMINSGDYGRIIKLTSVPTGTLLSNSVIQFQDALSGTNLFSGSGLTIAQSGNATTNIDGQPYYFKVYNGTSSSFVTVDWGTGASYGNPGNAITIAPKIKLKNGEWLAFIGGNITITNGTTYVLPGYDSLTTYEAGQKISCPQGVMGQSNASIAYGNTNYTLVNINNISCLMTGIDTDNNGVLDINFSANMGGAVIIQEPKKTTDYVNSVDGDVIGIYPAVVGSSTITIGVASPKVSGNFSGLISWTSDTNKQTGVDRYGSFLTYNISNNHRVTVSIPDQQMTAYVFFNSSVNSSLFNTNVPQLSYTPVVNGVSTYNVVLIDNNNNNPYVNFTWDYNQSNLDLSNLSFVKESSDGSVGYSIISGLNLSSQNQNKTIYIDRVLNGTDLCIKDAEISSLDNISTSCSGSNETLLFCPGSNGTYSCSLANGNTMYKVSGLTHSGVREIIVCGDGVCNGEETCSSCASDCGACASSSGSGGGGGGGSIVSGYWTNTYSLTDLQIAQGYTKELDVKERLSFNIYNIQHSAGVVALTSITATINVSSDSQQAVLNIGDEKKFNINNDNYYDLSVKLNSISNNKANLTVKQINELIVVPIANENNNTGNVVNNNGIGKNIVQGKVLNLSWFWLIIIVIIIILIALVIVVLAKKRRK